MIQVIHASIKGRARYKIKGLRRSESLKRHIEFRLAAQEEINHFSINILTGNILVFFDSNNDIYNIASVIEAIVIEHKETVESQVSIASSPEENCITKRSTVANSRQVYSRRKLRRLISSAEDQKVEPWHLMGVDAVLKSFGVNKNNGLDYESAKELLKKYGPNVLPESVPRSGLSILIGQFMSLPVALLGLAAGVSILTGGLADAIVIMSVVAINAVIGYTTESNVEKTIHSLKSLVRPSTLLIRCGKITEIGIEQVVPGDILVLRPGSYVAADARLIEVQHLSIDESALTGESMPVLKRVEAITSDSDSSDVPLADRATMVYMGTLVTGGQGLAVVVATGRITEIGKIQMLVGETKPPETPMERQLSNIGTQLVIIGSTVCGVVFLIGLLRGYSLLQMLKTSISLAVAAVPEGLPTVATTTLALGVRKMRQHNVLIRHLDAVEALGSVQTICLDKTGTITMNKMSVVSIYTGMRRIIVSNGKFISENENKDDSNHSFYNGKSYFNLYQCDELLRLIHVSVLCNESEVIRGNDQYIVNGSSTENALIDAAIGFGVDILTLRERFPLIAIQHRSEHRNFMITIHDIKIHGSANHHGKFIAVKGSPNEVLSMCGFYLKDEIKYPLTEDDRLSIETENDRMAGNAFRVLGFAYAVIDDEMESSDLQTLISENTPLLIWLGLVGMADPIRDGVKELIDAFHGAGIDTVIITGDQSPTAFAIGNELNLSKGKPLQVLDSTHLADVNPDIMRALCEEVHVFSRVSPTHKLQIVQALQGAGKIVAMTGDGVNDAPALKTADIGVAMGNTGTDVAREVADVVLEDDNLETMVIAISQGRTIYNNIRKSIHFLLSTNMSEIIVMFIAMAGGLGQPLSAMQLLWINLMSDIAPGIALALEPPEPDVLSRPPRTPDDSIIKYSDFKRITFESTMLSAGALGAYGYGIIRYGMGQRASTMAFMSLSISQILHAISCRSERHSIFDKEKLPLNKYLNTTLIGSFALQVLSMAVPGLRSLLGIAPINIIDGIMIGGSAILPLLVNESTKK